MRSGACLALLAPHGPDRINPASLLILDADFLARTRRACRGGSLDPDVLGRPYPTWLMFQPATDHPEGVLSLDLETLEAAPHADVFPTQSFSAAYLARIARFCAAPGLGSLSVEQITPDIIQRRLLEMARAQQIDGTKCNSFNNIVAALRAVFAKARKDGLIPWNPETEDLAAVEKRIGERAEKYPAAPPAARRAPGGVAPRRVERLARDGEARR